MDTIISCAPITMNDIVMLNFITHIDHITVTKSICDPTMETTGPSSLHPTSSTKLLQNPPTSAIKSSSILPTSTTKPPGIPPTSITKPDDTTNTASTDSSGTKYVLHVILMYGFT